MPAKSFAKFIVLLALFLSALVISAQVKSHYGITPQKLPTINKVVRLMNAGAYDSAEVLIIGELLDQKNKLTAYEEYFLNSYEAEIMYYNALFDIGLSSAEKCLAIGKELKNDTLIGSAQNLLGLQLMHLKQYKKAEMAFREAIKLLPLVTDKSLYSQRYHALANLAEVYLYEKNADSTIYYSELAVKESAKQGIARGTAFSYWSWAEGMLLLKRENAAKHLARLGLTWLVNNQVSDANLFLCLTMMKVYFTQGKLDSLEYYQNAAEYFMDTNANAASDYAKMAFLDFLVEFYTETGQAANAVATLNRARSLQGSVLRKQEMQRKQLLQTFYSNKQLFELANLRAESQQRELNLKNLINAILASFVLFGALFLFIGYRNLKHKQHIAELNHRTQLMDEQQRLELQVLKTRFEAVNKERDRIAADLHDEIGAALSSIRIFSNLAQKSNANPQNLESLLQKIGSTSAGLLERMSDIIWSISPEHDTLLDIKLRIRTIAADLLYPLGIKISYTANDADDGIVLSALARKNIYLCFKEGLNNIAKYSHATEVVISLKCSDTTLQGMVKDNGVGFNTIAKTTGHGLINIKKRIHALGGEFSYTSQPGEGMELHFEIALTNISD